MITRRSTRPRIIAVSAVLVLTAIFVASSFLPRSALADNTEPESGTFKIEVLVTAGTGTTLPTSDTVTVTPAGTQAADRISGNSSKATYETGTFSWSHAGNVPGATYKACSAILGSSDCINFIPTITLAGQGPEIITLSGTDTSSSTSTTTTTATAVPNEYPTCYTSNDPMSFILCPIFNSLSSISGWIFQNILTPFLVTAPISTNSSDTSFKIWSSFRVYGDIVLVLALLVAVIGQVIGGGIVDAYTFRKVIPRVLVAAILINLSVYIVALLVDITNIIGKSIGDIMTAPIAQNKAWNFTPNGVQSAGVFGAGLLGLLVAGGGTAVLADLFFPSSGDGAKAAFVKVALYAAMFVVLPIVLAMIAVFVTLIIRKGLILFLVIVSPIAFALYCLPNTEKYFKKWWDLLLEALLVYPIIVVIFALADVLAVTILSANGITKTQLTPNGTGQLSLAFDSIIATMVAFFLQFLPLLAIPFSFRMAGGTLSRLHEAVTTGSGKINEYAQKRGAMAKRDLQIQKMQAQKRMYDRLNNGNPDSKNAFLRKRHGYLARRAGGYDINGAMSAMKAESQKEFDLTTNNGDDTQLRAFSVNKRAALAGAEGDRWRYKMNADGSKSDKREFKTLGGRWVGEGDVDTAQQRWKGNHFKQQEVLAYEMRKATTQQQNDDLVTNYADTARGWGMDNNEAGSAWTGAAYANQGNKLDLKYYRWNDQAGGLQVDGQGLMQEIDESRGTYDMSKFTGDTWTTMQSQVKRARKVTAAVADKQSRGESVSGAERTQVTAANETLQRASRIARSFVQERGTLGSGGAFDGDEFHPPTPGLPGRGGSVVAIHGAAPRAQEEAENFVRLIYAEAEAPTPDSYQRQESADNQNRPTTSSKL